MPIDQVDAVRAASHLSFWKEQTVNHDAEWTTVMPSVNLQVQHDAYRLVSWSTNG
jgi:hypothetical protein